MIDMNGTVNCPVAICLQETHLKETDKFPIKNYTMYNNYAQTERESGGSSIAISNNIFRDQIDLKTNLQAIAVRFSLHKTITLCSIPPLYGRNITDTA